MGQATVELPEPTEQGAPPAPADADELLSQLAGEEIDRLLAEAEAGAAPEVTAATAARGELAAANESVSADAAEITPSSDLTPKTVASAASQPAVTVVATPAAPAAADADASTAPATAEADAAQAQLDELFNELTDVGSPADGPEQGESAEMQGQVDAFMASVASEATREAATDAAIAADAKSEPPPASADLEAELVASLHSSAAPPAARDEAPPATVQADAAGNSFIVKLLELINQPFAAMAAETRELLGKVAIVTACNAIVIFLYVLLFRS